MIEEKNINEPQNPAFLVGAVISRFSQLPRKGLLADFSQIGLEQLVEFRTNDFYDLKIFEMQLEHIKQRAKELNAQFVVYHMSSNNISMSDNYLMSSLKMAYNEQGFVSVWEFEKLMMNNLLKMNRITNVQDIGSSPNSTKPNVVGSLVNPHDRFKNAALFLCGYLKYSEDKVDDVASQIRRYAALNEPYELCTCQKCNQVVELQFYEGDDEECSHPHYTCPSSQCKAIYYDKSGKERWEELEHHYKEIEERYREQLEDSYDDDW